MWPGDGLEGAATSTRARVRQRGAPGGGRAAPCAAPYQSLIVVRALRRGASQGLPVPVQVQIVIFAVIAAFVLFQLYNVLGKKVGRKPE